MAAPHVSEGLDLPVIVNIILGPLQNLYVEAEYPKKQVKKASQAEKQDASLKAKRGYCMKAVGESGSNLGVACMAIMLAHRRTAVAIDPEEGSRGERMRLCDYKSHRKES